MQLTIVSGLIAIVSYLISSVFQARRLSTRKVDDSPGNLVFVFGLIAVLAHAVSAGTVIRHPDGYHFGIVQISTLIFASISLIVLISSLRKPFGALLVGLFPLAILSIVASLTITSTYPPQELHAGIAA